MRAKEYTREELNRIAIVVKERRNELGLTQEDVIDFVKKDKTLKQKVSRSALQNMESGRSASSSKLRSLSTALKYESLFDLLISAKVYPEIDANPILKDVMKRISSDANLTSLPSLFGTERRLPIADAYVELQLAATPKNEPNILALEIPRTAQSQLHEAQREQFIQRKNLRESLDDPKSSRALLVGRPGSGKSSLLRRISIDVLTQNWDQYSLPFF